MSGSCYRSLSRSGNDITSLSAHRTRLPFLGWYSCRSGKKSNYMSNSKVPASRSFGFLRSDVGVR